MTSGSSDDRLGWESKVSSSPLDGTAPRDESSAGTGDGDGTNHAHRDYGPGWANLREETFRRDGYQCQRCGAEDRTLQAHHIVPRSAGGPDTLENLITLCRPCHGVQHPRNGAFDDADPAPLFPDRDAPTVVARMRGPEDQVCSRCGSQYDDATELLAWDDPPGDAHGREYLILCKPCAGVVVEADRLTREDLRGNQRFSLTELADRSPDAAVRPSVFAPPAVAHRRPPRSLRERLVDDTPARLLWNNTIGRLVLAIGLLTVVLVAIALTDVSSMITDVTVILTDVPMMLAEFTAIRVDVSTMLAVFPSIQPL